MAEVSWMAAALDDLDQIVEFVRRGSYRYSMIVAEKLRNSARDLARFPTIGRIIPEFNDPVIRDRIVYNYRVIYTIRGEQVIVVAVLHGARDAAPILRERLPRPSP